MSDAPAAPAEGAKPLKSKKMMVIVLAVVVLLGVGTGAFFMFKPKAEIVEDGAAAPAAAHVKPGAPPTFLPMDSLVVNLSDAGGDRFAQIGITLEISDTHAADLVKAFMPAIRSGILMVVSQRTTQELLQREGKEKLARDIRREVSKPLGFEVEEDEAEAEAEEPPATKKSKAKPKTAAVHNPIERVLFSSFIVQ